MKNKIKYFPDLLGNEIKELNRLNWF